MMGDSYVKNALWEKYGLCVDYKIIGMELESAIQRQDLMADYMERHPEIAEQYLPVDKYPKQIYLYDVLNLAEAERDHAGSKAYYFGQEIRPIAYIHPDNIRRLKEAQGGL